MVDPTLIPEDEATRIAAVRRYDILDTPADGSFDRIIALAARHFDAPISIVSIVDSDRIRSKAHHGTASGMLGPDGLERIVAAVPEGAGAGDLVDALRGLLAGDGIEIRDDVAALALEAG